MAIGDGEDGRIGDVEVGAVPNNGAPALNDMGLDADEARLFQEMQDGDAAAPAPPPDDLGADADLPLNEAAAKRNAPAADDDDGGEPAPAPAPAAAAADKNQPEPDEFELPAASETQQTVAYGKYRRELARLAERGKKYKEAAAQLPTIQTEHEKLKAENAKLTGRFEMLVDAINKSRQAAPAADAEAAKADPAKEDPEPDVENEPFKWIAWSQREMRRVKEAVAAGTTSVADRVAKVETNLDQSAEDAAVFNAYSTDAQQFSAREPLFGAAYNFLKLSRYKEIARVGFHKPLLVQGADGKQAWNVTADELQEIARRFMAEERGIATKMLKARQSPAQHIWDLAQDRGFDPAAAKAQMEAAAKANGDGKGNGAAAPAKAAAAKPSVSEQVKAIREGVDASKSLSDGGAAPEGGRLTMRQIADMSEAKFDELYNRLGKEGINEALLGGPPN